MTPLELSIQILFSGTPALFLCAFALTGSYYSIRVKYSNPVNMTDFVTVFAIRRAYRWGMLGPFQKYTELDLVDQLQRIKNVWGKAFLGRVIWPYKKLRARKYNYPGF